MTGPQTPTRTLYVCYLSADDPLVHTQVVAYLAGLAATGHHIRLLTFETRRLSRQRRRAVRSYMATQGIAWHGLRYHKRPSLPATIYDTLAGACLTAALVLRYRLTLLHARSHVPAAMAMIAIAIVAILTPPPGLIFDIRGLMAEEYEDAGHWKRKGLPFRLTKLVERAAIRRADGIVVLTHRVRHLLFATSPSPQSLVIPCCADLETLAAQSEDRARVRETLGLTDAVVMVYLGKFGTWYMAAEMAGFFVVARRAIPNLRFLILTQGEQETIRHELRQRNIDDRCIIFSVPATSVGSYLAASDFGISFIRPGISKISSSPTKVGEYLGAGLPVVCTAGVGDLDTLLTPDVGVLVADHANASYKRAAEHIMQLLKTPATRERCRSIAEQHFSLSKVGVPRYAQLYARVADAAGSVTSPTLLAKEDLKR